MRSLCQLRKICIFHIDYFERIAFCGLNLLSVYVKYQIIRSCRFVSSIIIQTVTVFWAEAIFYIIIIRIIKTAVVNYCTLGVSARISDGIRCTCSQFIFQSIYYLCILQRIYGYTFNWCYGRDIGCPGILYLFILIPYSILESQIVGASLRGPKRAIADIDFCHFILYSGIDLQRIESINAVLRIRLCFKLIPHCMVCSTLDFLIPYCQLRQIRIFRFHNGVLIVFCCRYFLIVYEKYKLIISYRFIVPITVIRCLIFIIFPVKTVVYKISVLICVAIIANLR